MRNTPNESWESHKVGHMQNRRMFRISVGLYFMAEVCGWCMAAVVTLSVLNYGDIGLILGLYWDNGKENGNYYLLFRV